MMALGVMERPPVKAANANSTDPRDALNYPKSQLFTSHFHNLQLLLDWNHGLQSYSCFSIFTNLSKLIKTSIRQGYFKCRIRILMLVEGRHPIQGIKESTIMESLPLETGHILKMKNIHNSTVACPIQGPFHKDQITFFWHFESQFQLLKLGIIGTFYSTHLVISVPHLNSGMVKTCDSRYHLLCILTSKWVICTPLAG